MEEKKIEEQIIEDFAASWRTMDASLIISEPQFNQRLK